MEFKWDRERTMLGSILTASVTDGRNLIQEVRVINNGMDHHVEVGVRPADRASRQFASWSTAAREPGLVGNEQMIPRGKIFLGHSLIPHPDTTLILDALPDIAGLPLNLDVKGFAREFARRFDLPPEAQGYGVPPNILEYALPRTVTHTRR